MTALIDGLAGSFAEDQEPVPGWLSDVAAELRVHATVGADLHLASTS